MGTIRFNISKDNLIILNLIVYSETLESSLTMNAALDTGAARSIIPPKVASNLGYDISEPKDLIEFSGVYSSGWSKVISVSKIEAIGESVNDMDIVLHQLAPDITADAILGLDFLRNFDTTISYSKGIVEIKPIARTPENHFISGIP